MNIIHHEPPGEYRVDIITGSKQTGTHYFTAPEAEATDTARRIVVSLGGDAGNVYQDNGVGGATFYDAVVVE